MLEDIVKRLLESVKGWDWKAIFYSFIATVFFAIIAKWTGMIRGIQRRYRLAESIRAYRKSILKFCSSLIIVGKRQGFLLQDVYVDLDLAISDMSTSDLEYPGSRPRNFVLIGGPGAGKSTYVKRLVVDNIDGNFTPFLVRLREYDGDKPIEECLAEDIARFKMPNPLNFTIGALQSGALCVLDGLDEVRPNTADLVYKQINHFYNHFFKDGHFNNCLIVTCRKEAYRNIPLDIPFVFEVRPLTDEQIQRYAKKWPLDYPEGKDEKTFWRDLSSSPRILELARSPLLLTGGLMQYTESNLGIPEQRVQYFERIANWLIADWAKAQGHPPDTYRPVYSRIIPKLALELHRTQRPECPSSEAAKLIGEWLPSFGYPKEDGKNVLDSIIKRTGILVHDTPSTVVFAQFGLQEYFASIDAIEQIGLEALARIIPKSWWRETILLAASQLKNPEPFLQELFKEDPLLASNVVAECPTPSIIYQEKAIDTCLYAVDNGEEAVYSALVALLRTVRGQQEIRLISELEQRLTSEKEISSKVAQMLATADTISATNALTRHPEIWDVCMEETGYFSNSFEKQLVNWVKDGDENQSKHAIDLLTPRLSRDRYLELINLLDIVPNSKASYLAIALLKNINIRSPRDQEPLEEVCKCIQHIDDRQDALTFFKDRLNKDRWGRVYRTSALIRTCLFMDFSRGYKPVLDTFTSSIVFSNYFHIYLNIIASALCVLFVNFHSLFFNNFLILSTLLFCISIAIRNIPLAWQKRFFSSYLYAWERLLPMVVGVVLLITFGVDFVPNNQRFYASVGLAILYTLNAAIIYLNDDTTYEHSDTIIIVTACIWIILLVIAIVLRLLGFVFVQQLAVFVSIPFVIIPLVSFFQSYRKWRHVRAVFHMADNSPY